MWHVLRHTYASVLAAGAIRRDVVERLMGHAGKGTTSIYTHLFRDAFDGVEEALGALFGVNGAINGCDGHHESQSGTISRVIRPGALRCADIWCPRWFSWFSIVTLVRTYHI